MNVTYKDLEDGYILKDGDKITIHGAKHRVCLSIPQEEYYLNYEGVSNYALDEDRTPDTLCNDFIFRLLHIPNKESFVKDIAGKDFSGAGSFPQVKTLEALTEVAIALLEKPLYNVGDYVTVRKEIKGHKYSLDFLGSMQELAGKTFYVKNIEKISDFSKINNGEIYWYLLNNAFYWDAAMIMPATEEEKKSVNTSDKGEPEEKKEEKTHFVTLADLNCGYIFKEYDHIRINGMDCVIHTSGDDTRFWLSLDGIPEQKIYESLGIPEDKKKELAKLCGATDLCYHSPEFSNLESLSAFVIRILMYKKVDKKSSEKKWSGNPSYFDLKNGRILEKDDILNIHGVEYRVTDGASDGKRCWLTTSGIRNSFIFDKLRIDDKDAFVRGICSIVDYGDFPEVGSFEDLTKVAIALYEVPEFKVGDKVRVAHREGKEGDYPWYFTDEMLALRDKVYSIKAVDVYGYCFSGKSYERLSKDPHCYHLDAEGKDFDWHSSMLEKVSESDKKSEEPSKKESFITPSQISLSDLQSGYTLNSSDIVCLCKEEYRVISGGGFCFLNNISGGFNGSVFDKLGIKDKMYFCSLYGTVSSGDFPEFNRLDALTACVKQLMILEKIRDCKGDGEDTPSIEVIKAERLNFAMDISKSDKPSDTGTVRLPEIKDDFKIIL